MLRRFALFVALSLDLSAGGQPARQLARATQRHSPSDLEVLTLDSAGVTRSTVFLSRGYLASLPQISSVLTPDSNFPELPPSGARITGVDLNTLIHSFDPSAAVVAVCRDGYVAPFPQQALQDHHPILVYAIDGISPHQWAIKHHAYDPGPYFVTYTNFVPSFHILRHEDFPQHPAEILQIKLLPPTSLFSGITPPNAAQLPPDSPILDGFRIAQQNCVRCHQSGATGGTKAHGTWQHLAEVAKIRPEFFADWVHNPQALDPHDGMPPNLKYDQATLKALTRYFQTFAPEK
jgi:mono/diheme cytochrome c family protein